MHSSEAEKIQETIFALVQSSTIPLTATELRVRLRVRAVRLAEYEVLRVLRSLRTEGLVYLEQERWRIVSAFIPRLIPDPLAQQTRVRDRLSIQRATLLPAARSTTTTALPLPPSEVLHDVPQSKEQVPTAAKPMDFSGPWGTFRRLLGYYANCIRNDEGCEASSFLQDYGERFIFLNQVGTWYPRVGQSWHLSLPTGSHLHTLVRKLALAGEDGVLVLGYPFQVFTRLEGKGPEGVFVKPVFTYQLSWHLQAASLQVWSDDPWAEVNLDWLTYALKKPEQQRMFLSACGLMDRGQSDESFGDGSRFASAPDLRTLAAGITTFFGERIREPLRPESVPSMPLPVRPESGIYNRAVLMIGNRTRYAKSLLKELSRIAACNDEELEKTALRFIFKSSVPIQTPEEPAPDQIVDDNMHERLVVDTCPLNGEQREAVASLLTEHITVVTGPPGTGKSQVVTAAMANARLQDTSVLFASRNHKALDAVVERLVVDGQPLIVRANSKEDTFLKFGFENALSQLLSNEYSVEEQEKWEAIRRELTNLLKQRGELGVQVRRVQTLQDRLGTLEQHMATLAVAWPLEAQRELNQHPALFPSKALTELEHVIGGLRHVEEVPGWFTRLGWWLKDLSQQTRVRSVCRLFQQHYPSWQFVLAHRGFHSLQHLASQLPRLLQAAE